MRILLLGLLFILSVGLYMHSIYTETQRQKRIMAHVRYMQYRADDEGRARRIQEIRARIPVPQKNAPPTWDEVMDAAELYHRGSFPDVAPNPIMARRTYEAIAQWCPHPEYVYRARMRLLEKHIHKEDVRGPTLPSVTITLPPTTPDPTPPPQTIYNDRQNSHDHGVVASIRAALNSLPTTDDGDARNEIEATLFSPEVDMTDEEKAKALTVLQSLRADHLHSQFNVTELGALNAVWSRLQSIENADKQYNAKETLCKQLASGIERGATVCTTGKIARIVSALDGVDKPTMKPMWAVKEELGSLASKIREDCLGNASPADRRAYDRGEAPDLEQRMRDTLQDKARALYVKELGMDDALITLTLDPILEGF